MKALILAAGRGSRLGNLTEDKPKCMVNLFGQPLLNHQIKAIKNAAIDNIAIVTGYKSNLIKNESIKKYFYNSYWESTNMVQSLISAHEWLSNDNCIVSYSDIFYPQHIINELAYSTGEVVISYDKNFKTLWNKRFENALDDLETFIIDDYSNLISIGSRTNSYENIMGQYMGLIKLTNKAWKKIYSFINDKYGNIPLKLDMTSLLMDLITNNIVIIKTIPFDGCWGEVDNKSDIDFYESHYQHFICNTVE